MHRLFVAIRPPRVIRAALLEQKGGIAGARWQDDDQLHITLRFIGEVDGGVAEDVATLLNGVHAAPFDAVIDGIGSFDRRGSAAVLWAGVQPAEPLKALHRKVDQACVRAGLAPDQRAFHPHITLARLGRTAGPVKSFAERGFARTAPFRVGGFELFESVLTPQGAHYSSVARYPLD